MIPPRIEDPHSSRGSRKNNSGAASGIGGPTIILSAENISASASGIGTGTEIFSEIFSKSSVQIVLTMASSTDAAIDQAATRHGQPGTPVDRLFKNIHTPPQDYDDEERKKMRLASTGFFGPSRLVFDEGEVAAPASVDPHANLLSQIGGLLKEQLAPVNQSVELLRTDFNKMSMTVHEDPQAIGARLEAFDQRLVKNEVRMEKLENLVQQMQSASSSGGDPEIRKRLEAMGSYVEEFRQSPKKRRAVQLRAHSCAWRASRTHRER